MIPQFDSRTCCLHHPPTLQLPSFHSFSARIKLVEAKNKNNGFSKSWLSQKPIGKWSWDIMLSILQARQNGGSVEVGTMKILKILLFIVAL